MSIEAVVFVLFVIVRYFIPEFLFAKKILKEEVPELVGMGYASFKTRLVLSVIEEISDTKPQRKKENGTESPVNYALCVKDESSKSQTGIDNDNVDELLTRVQTALNEMAGSSGHSTQTHE